MAFSSSYLIKNIPPTEAQLKTMILNALEFISCFALTRIEIQIEPGPEKEKMPETIKAPVSANLIL